MLYQLSYSGLLSRQGHEGDARGAPPYGEWLAPWQGSLSVLWLPICVARRLAQARDIGQQRQARATS